MEQSKVKPHREKGKALEPAKRFKGAYRHTHTYTHTHVHTHIYLFCVIFLERNLLPNIHFAFYHFCKPVSGSRESACLS